MAGVTHIDRSIDARGMPCPGPLMSLIGAIRESEVGAVIEVLSSDEGSRTDIPAWIHKAGHEMVETVEDDGFARFVVRKAR
ncbi:MAG TPA: sulfurtransferase TusA family protein [Actinomycetota bacterium]|jgi:TusA-related sulfurtransferase|nr:sulfurtransferase TusA family protein [Actinomycetota bacterium]